MRQKKELKDSGWHTLTVRFKTGEFKRLKVIQARKEKIEHRKVSYTEIVLAGVRLQDKDQPSDDA